MPSLRVIRQRESHFISGDKRIPAMPRAVVDITVSTSE
jgi:hypothetical protein